MASPPPQLESNHKERFFRYFQYEVTALQEQMRRIQTSSPAGGELTDALDHCRAGIDHLSHEVKDASSYIPAYDQRTYAEAIKALSEKLQGVRSSMGGKKKFSFKIRKNESAISLADAAELAKGGLKVPGAGRGGSGGGGAGGGGSQSVGGVDSGVSSMEGSSFATTPLDKMSPGEEKRELGLLAKNGESSNSTTHTATVDRGKSVSISNHTGAHIILPASSTDSTRSGTVLNLRHSAVDLSPRSTNGGKSFANLTLKNLKDSLIVCAQVSGPIHITSVEHSVLVVACRQFRMHGSKNVDVYLHCSSRPIIEDCETIRFAPLPSTYVTEEISASTNQWNQIDDFKWLKAEPSPHFSVLPEADRVKEEVWKNTVPGGNHSVSLDDILKAVGVLRGASTVT